MSMLTSQNTFDFEDSVGPADNASISGSSSDESAVAPRKRQKLSAVWTYFTLSEDEKSAICSLCSENNR
jgi:hypothetical protein